MSSEEQLIQQMSKALQKARIEIEELTEMVMQLTAPTLSYGVVLKTGGKIKFPKPADPKSFKPGTKVKIKEELMVQYNLGFPNGKIRRIDEGEAVVDFVENKRIKVPLGSLYLQDPEYTEMETITIMSNGSMKEVFPPKGIELESGDIITINGAGGITGKGSVTQYGNSAVVKEILPDNYCKIEDGGNTRIIFYGKVPDLEKGDNVLLDSTNTIVVKNTKQESQEFQVSSSINVSWDEIGGLEDIKEQMHEMVELPHSKPEVFQYYNKKPAKGVILYGPPGCGKTLVAKAIATSLAKIYGGSLTDSGFIYIKGPEILNPYVGVTEQTIRQIFERARQYKQKTGYPATIFIDEVDAILSKRGTGVSSDMDKTIVPMFLAEMDGLVDSSAFIVMATNRVDTLDPAVLREGRIDVKFKVSRPDMAAARNIIRINLAKTKVMGNVEDIVAAIVDIVYTSNLKNSISGAMLAGIVDQTISEAIRRDLKSKGKPTGITVADAESAVEKLAVRETEMPKQEEIPV